MHLLSDLMKFRSYTEVKQKAQDREHVAELERHNPAGSSRRLEEVL